ncbi:MAG: MFS transporter [Xenococcaceae cyanobacterium MO_234.B1]|nr:MFS transporter [Xenococcaceae cyanobacterium MO_234.B1]
MRIFLTVWIGQVISLFGSKLSEFALGFWMLEQTYRDTGRISQFALIIFLIYLPKVIVSPIAGVLIDRWNRRSAMILSDGATCIVTLIIMLLALSDKLAVWHIYLAVTITSTFNAFQLPAYTAAIAQLVPPKQYSRANGMVQVSSGIAKIASPLVAGILMKLIALEGILTIDLITFFIAIFTLISVRFPTVKRMRKRRQVTMEGLLTETILGWKYIAVKPGLLKLLSFIAISYFSNGMLEVILWPLLYQPNSTERLGTILSIGGFGILVGSVLISVWGGAKNRVKTIMTCVAIQGIVILTASFKISLVIMALGIFVYLFCHPIIISSNQAIWQSKVPSRLQGRVFSLQQSLERGLAICAYSIAGPLVDGVLNPLMAENGLLANTIGKFIGGEIGQNQGIALLLLLLGILNLLTVILAYQEPRLRFLEKELPDRNLSSLDLSSVKSS